MRSAWTNARNFRGVIGSLALGLTGWAAAGERNYQAIVDRNPFALKPPVVVPPPDPQANNKPNPASNINLTGITTDLESKKVWLRATVNGKTPPTVFYSLAEGEKQDDIEVISIDEISDTVKILNAGAPVTLTYATHGVKDKGAAAPINTASVPPVPAGMPSAMPVPGAAGGGGGPVVIGRGGVLVDNNPNPTGASTFIMNPPGGVNNNSAAGVTTGAARIIPSRALRTQAQSDYVQPVGGEPSMPVEQQVLNMVAQKLDANNRGVKLPPLPPIPGIEPIPGVVDGLPSRNNPNP
ncbi:MAG: hypothetical protein FJ404_04135 [Verrucomicrobia bacterium]|nr:hypothetical protein [Verrucomicrobiota bacterium]